MSCMPITTGLWSGLRNQFHTDLIAVNSDNGLAMRSVKILANASKQTLVVVASVVCAIATPIFALFDGIYHGTYTLARGICPSLFTSGASAPQETKKPMETVVWKAFYDGKSMFRELTYWNIISKLEDDKELDIAFCEVLFPTDCENDFNTYDLQKKIFEDVLSKPAFADPFSYAFEYVLRAHFELELLYVDPTSVSDDPMTLRTSRINHKQSQQQPQTARKKQGIFGMFGRKRVPASQENIQSEPKIVLEEEEPKTPYIVQPIKDNFCFAMLSKDDLNLIHRMLYSSRVLGFSVLTEALSSFIEDREEEFAIDLDRFKYLQWAAGKSIPVRNSISYTLYLTDLGGMRKLTEIL